MRRIIIVLGLIATVSIVGAAFAQTTDQPKSSVVRYLSTDLPGDATRTVAMQSVTMPPGAGNQFHRHPGDQWTTVQEGEITYTIQGQPPKILKAGDSVFSARGVVHRNQNLGTVQARTVETLIADKDKPSTEFVP